MTNDKTPAEFILEILGGTNKLSVAVGAKNFVISNDGLSITFEIPMTPKNKVQFIKISLTSLDNYIVEFSKKTRNKIYGYPFLQDTFISKYEDVPISDLKPLIQDETGLVLDIV